MLKSVLKNIKKRIKPLLQRINVKKTIHIGIIAGFLFSGVFVIWLTTIELPDLNNFDSRIITESTKIYDRTGKVVLFDVHGNIRRTIVPLDKISDHVKSATIAIEDSNFYNHKGIEPLAIFRAISINLIEGNLFSGQGGSTITQQVLKNSLLTSDKKVSRKIKEWILAPRLESKLTKDEILEIYLNEVPYGGTVYGIQEAARRFFGKDASELSLTESAYLAALPQAPTYFSPYGNNLDRLENRKNKVLKEMLSNGFITESEYAEALDVVIEFEKQEDYGIKAPHFVMFIREQLEEKYGADIVEQGGLKVITTLDWDLQKEGEEIVKKYALENSVTFNAENGSIVAIDPKTGQILAMVGSRDYFDEEIDGNFNIATTERQPGSAFKPFVYAEAFNKGYLPETVVFDVPTEFSTTCSSGGNCYNPVNYDNLYVGPISLRNALAQSRNIPAVKVLYLAGLQDALDLAKRMGLTTLTNTKRYGLTLVLGGGEVRPLDMASAYGVFANDGVKNKTSGILKVEDRKGKVLEEYKQEETRVTSEQTARLISSILSDNAARAPLFGENSLLNFGAIDVAAKTGTTNDYRDAWIVGYTPGISVAAWAGNNDNSSMAKKTSGLIVSPMWAQFMRLAIEKYPSGSFINPAPFDPNTKAILRGDWQGAAQQGGLHSILHWVDRANPTGPPPPNPSRDSQYYMWEAPISGWGHGSSINTNTVKESNNKKSELQITNPKQDQAYLKTLPMNVQVNLQSGDIASGKVYLNTEFIGDLNPRGGIYTFIPSQMAASRPENTLRVEVVDEYGDKFESEIRFGLLMN